MAAQLPVVFDHETCLVCGLRFHSSRCSHSVSDNHRQVEENRMRNIAREEIARAASIARHPGGPA